MNEIARIAAQPAYSEIARKTLERRPALFIDGEWVASSGDALIPVHDPSTGKQIASVVDASVEDVDRAVAAARRAFDDGRWSGLSPYQRERAIHGLADLIEAHIPELAELESIDNGKPRASSEGYDLPRSVSTLRYMAGWATRLTGETLDPANFPSGAVHAYIRREPIGVCAQIVPWNYPLMMAVQKIAPALAAGCTMVLKPAEQTPLTALRLADLVAEAGIPAGVVNIITGYGETAGDRMVRHPDVDKIGFTGSTDVGKIISRAATDTLKRVTLELGGKSPVIVLPDVDIGQAAAGAARSIFSNAGQVCIAGSRLFAHRDVFDRLLEAVAENAGRLKVGPSLAPETTMGPLVSSEQRERVLGYIESGRKEGASVLVGGDAPTTDGGWFVNPTVLVDVKPQMRVVREEIFGPVLAAQRFDDLDEVAKAANDTPYGLSASIWTRDLSAMHRLAAKLKSGMVWGNCTSAADSSMPFGGVKQSGLGREGGRAGIEAYTELKTVGIML
ncbi:aldehyde dehydrogenase family protein [Sphingomonas parva]|uniref:Aldehyde dehydrogenase family protein n=1 Tax=Sphingomonas parva TaxID=2555898 RepID=A0A4Y8ZVV9_9SPHN|nr:aldehyde dehydrogenase family protein [Sphingomonas parva]TFI60054.1 aldehyde dehydrogenase family protein [Sphingomonas parva]